MKRFHTKWASESEGWRKEADGRHGVTVVARRQKGGKPHRVKIEGPAVGRQTRERSRERTISNTWQTMDRCRALSTVSLRQDRGLPQNKLTFKRLSNALSTAQATATEEAPQISRHDSEDHDRPQDRPAIPRLANALAATKPCDREDLSGFESLSVGLSSMLVNASQTGATEDQVPGGNRRRFGERLWDDGKSRRRGWNDRRDGANVIIGSGF
jgi:hypothetical protein